MKKIIVLSYPHTSDYKIVDNCKTQEELTNLMSSYGIIKVKDHVSVYTKRPDTTEYFYEGDVCLVEGSRFALWFLNKLWGDEKNKGIFSYEAVNDRLVYMGT